MSTYTSVPWVALMSDKCSKEASQPITGWSSLPTDNIVPYLALIWQLQLSHCLFSLRNQHVPPISLGMSREISKGTSTFVTDFYSNCFNSKPLTFRVTFIYLISEWSGFLICEKKERKLFLPLSSLVGRQPWGKKQCFLLEHRLVAQRGIHWWGKRGGSFFLACPWRNKISEKKSQKTNEELAKVQPKVTLLINFALMVLGHRN